MILLKAVLDSRPKQARLLLKAGVNVDSVDSDGVTALMSVSTLNNVNVRRILARLLLAYHADCNKRDNSGQTALSWACKYGRANVIDLILKSKNGIDLDFNSDDKDGRSYLFLSASSGNHRVIQKIIEPMRKACGLKLHRADNEGVTPVEEAFRQGHYDCVKVLIKEGKAPVSSIVNYLNTQGGSDASIRMGFIRDILRFKRISPSGNNNFSLSSFYDRERLLESDVEEYLLSDFVCVGRTLPEVETSPNIYKNIKKRTIKAKHKQLAIHDSKGVVKLFSLYAEQYTTSFVRESFPLLRPLPPLTTNTHQVNSQGDSMSSQYVQSTSKNSPPNFSTARYSNIPPLPKISEHKHTEETTRRKTSLRKKQSSDNTFIFRKRSSMPSMAK